MGEALKGRTALITGSTSGIGTAYAKALASEGAAIMLNGFGNPADIEALRAAIADEHAVPAFYNGADMTIHDEIRNMIADATERLGKVDILINNAGLQHRSLVDDFPIDKWNALFAVNVTAPFVATQAVLPQMRARLGSDHQHSVGQRVHYVTGHVGLYRNETRDHGIHKISLVGNH